MTVTVQGYFWLNLQLYFIHECPCISEYPKSAEITLTVTVTARRAEGLQRFPMCHCIVKIMGTAIFSYKIYFLVYCHVKALDAVKLMLFECWNSVKLLKNIYLANK